MKRVNFHLTTEQIESLKKMAFDTEISVAKLIRRAIDIFLKNELKNEKN